MNRRGNLQGGLSAALEDYLEAIFRIEKNKRAARVRDIAGRVGVTKSTVNAALKSLAAKGLVEHEPYELIVLTPEGRTRALAIAMNHSIISHFLQGILALGRERAEHIACELEHAVDRQTMERLVCFLAFMQKFAAEGSDLMGEFRRFLSEGHGGQSCQTLVREYRARVEAEVEAG
ncbi:MAG: metal-dependent transcriptional regulator [Spirochaetales bacterium]|nr:metal-dependent transcriptional regulator [Spirochaetales bacterium]